MKRLEGKIILAAGGDRDVGQRIARSLTAEGAVVIVPELGELDDESAALALKQRVLEKAGRLDAVVAWLADGYRGPRLVDASGEDWDKLITSALRQHFVLAKTFVPVLAEHEGTSYLLINDTTAYTPKRGAGIAAAAAAGELMMARSLAVETGGRPHVHTLVLSEPLPRSVDSVGPGIRLTPDNVGEAVVRLVEDASAAGADVVLDSDTSGWAFRQAPGEGYDSYL